MPAHSAHRFDAGDLAPDEPRNSLRSLRDSRELLFDSEAILRLVDGALTDLRTPVAGGSTETTPPSGSDRTISREDLPAVVIEAATAIEQVLDDVREGRRQLPSRRLQNLYGETGRLEELSSTTAMLERLGRALSIVDSMDRAGRQGARQGVDPLAGLRHELFAVMNCLQFHADTGERVNQAARILADTEVQLTRVAEIVSPTRLGLDGPH